MQTWGNVGDGSAAGWLIRHVAQEGEVFPPFVEPPADLDTPTQFCLAVHLAGAFSVPHAADFAGGPAARFDAAERVDDEMNAVCAAWRSGGERLQVEAPVLSTSRLYGHSAAGTSTAHEVLREVRPLRDPDDEYVLVMAVASWPCFDGWFGDAGELEVWMRSSDLASGAFDQAWCMIRDD